MKTDCFFVWNQRARLGVGIKLKLRASANRLLY